LPPVPVPQYLFPFPEEDTRKVLRHGRIRKCAGRGAVAYRVGPLREIDVNRQAMKIPLASRIQGRSPGWGCAHDVLHVDKSDEGQSRIAVDNCQDMMRVIVGHFVRAIIAAVRSRAGFTVPGGDAAGDALRPS